MVRLLTAVLAAALVTACIDPGPPPDGGHPPVDAGPDGGGPDGGDPDGGEPDAGPVVRVDWREQRGADLEVTALPLAQDERLFGMTSTGVILQGGCDGGTCDYAWLQPDGGVQQPKRAMRPPFSAPSVSAPGTRMLMMEAPSFSSCTFQNEPFPILTGDLHLLDTETGEALTTLAGFETHPWGETQFTPMGRWFRPAPRAGGVCGSFAEELRRTEAPYDIPAGWRTGLVVEDELPDGRWVALDNQTGELGFVDPETAGSFDAIAAAVQYWYVRDGWTYAFEHAPVRRIVVETPSGTRHVREPPADEGWYPTTTSERWIAMSEWISNGLLRRYRLVDAKGEYPDVVLSMASSRVGQGLHLLGSADLVLVTGPDESGDVRPRLVDLRSGAVTRPMAAQARAVTLGKGEAAIAFDQEAALLIERDRIEPVATGPITDVYSANLPGSALPLPQRDVAMIVRSPSTGVFALDVFHLRTRRLVQLSDRIFYGPQLGWGLADESCGRPWVTRSVGDGSDTLRTPSRALYFLEYEPWPQWPSLYVAPLDLSAPPRRLGRVQTSVYCHAPLLSLDGHHVGAIVDGYDTEPRRWLQTARLGE